MKRLGAHPSFCRSLGHSAISGIAGKGALLLFAALVAVSCTSTGGRSRIERLVPVDWQVATATAVSPPLMIGRRVPVDGYAETLVVYIEGDGRAWSRPNIPPRDPTPRDPLGLKLAMATPEGFDVAYLARPCQYLSEPSDACTPDKWTLNRYGAANLRAMEQALDQVITEPSQPLVLVGYSGGGVMAALLAARRNDVAGLITVAANLDTEAWTTIHKVSPLSGSYNPVDFADALVRVPQLHFSGKEDEVVPLQVADSYLSQLGLSRESHLVSLEGFDHGCCWEEEWPTLFHQAMMRLE